MVLLLELEVLELELHTPAFPEAQELPFKVFWFGLVFNLQFVFMEKEESNLIRTLGSFL